MPLFRFKFIGIKFSLKINALFLSFSCKRFLMFIMGRKKLKMKLGAMYATNKYEIIIYVMTGRGSINNNILDVW